MRKILLLSCLWWMISSLSSAVACTITTTASGTGTYVVGAQITLTAVASSDCPPVTQMAFYNGATLLGIVMSSPYQYIWNTTGVTPATYNDVIATAAFASSVGPQSNPKGTIDVVGDPAYAANPALNPMFGEGGTGSWLEGDNQMCLATVPYNGSSAVMPDGTCEWTGSGAALPASMPPPVPTESTVDGPDDVMHTLSDFVNFSNNLLAHDIGTLNATFQTWYPQAAGWIAQGTSQCDDNSACAGGLCADGTNCGASADGRLLSIYNPYTGADKLSQWDNLITNWLGTVYTDSNAWCVPPGTTGSAVEDAYINANSNGSTTWGDLPHVIACLNYNASAVPTTNFQTCQNLLLSGACPSSVTGTACDPATLGRSLAGPLPAVGYDGCNGQYLQWVQNSLALASDEAPKFQLRSLFLTDVYNRAKTMQSIFLEGDQALIAFLKPCAASDTACQSGGPAAQLTYAYDQSQNGNSTANLPNAVIYGWQDNLSNGATGGCKGADGSRVGCSHIVKVTAYSTGRAGTTSYVSSLLPWIKTSTHGFLGLTRSYTLEQRDGYVYVDVKRWDEDHDAVSFPNGNELWQSIFHNSGGVTTTGKNLMQVCNGLTLPASSCSNNSSSSNSCSIGFGLTAQTVNGLGYNNQLSAADQTSLAGAFMLNDEGTGPNEGAVDPNAKTNNGAYLGCLQLANLYLSYGTESHACAEYVASRPSDIPCGDSASVESGSSGNGDCDYSIKFVSCPSSMPDDLTGH